MEERGAILEHDLVAVRDRLLRKWCDYLIEQYERKEEKRRKSERKAQAKYEQAGEGERFRPGAPTDLFAGDMQSLISLALLFYQNVPPDRFSAFIAPYTETIARQALRLDGETFTVEQLWQPDESFQCERAVPLRQDAMPAVATSVPWADDRRLHLNTVLRLPHRLIHIDAIAYTGAEGLDYHIRLGPPADAPAAIRMDEVARLVDHVGALDAAFLETKREDTAALVRRVFKPNSQFPHLLVDRYPKNFKRDRNFSSPLDHCIRWYILSPFDRSMAKWLKKAVHELAPGGQVDYRAQVRQYAAQSDHLKKCVRYVLARRQELAQAAQRPVPGDLEAQIEREYIELLVDCCRLLIEQREKIRPIFEALSREPDRRD